MKIAQGDVLTISTTIALMAVTAAITWFLTGSDPKNEPVSAKAPPAKVSTPLKETDLIAVQLTPEAERHLGLEVRPIESRKMSRARTYGAEVIPSPGKLLTVVSPLGGSLAVAGQRALTAGTVVRKGEILFHLTPLLTPDARANLAAFQVDAEGQIKNAQTQLSAADINLQRAKQLFQSEAGSKRSLEDAQAQFDIARQTLDAAEARRKVLEQVISGSQTNSVPAIDIQAPVDGIVRNVFVAGGESVPSAHSLLEIINLDKVWVRVPVYVGDLDDVERAADAQLSSLAARPGKKSWLAKPIETALAGNAQAATVDLYYALENTGSDFSPGQRVAAALQLKGNTDRLVIPWSAVIYDIYGGTWVYTRTAPQKYSRLRVLVDYVDGEWAVIQEGPKPGTAVVTAGAAELFGTEVGFAK